MAFFTRGRKGTCENIHLPYDMKFKNSTRLTKIIEYKCENIIWEYIRLDKRKVGFFVSAVIDAYREGKPVPTWCCFQDDTPSTIFYTHQDFNYKPGYCFRDDPERIIKTRRKIVTDYMKDGNFLNFYFIHDGKIIGIKVGTLPQHASREFAKLYACK